MVAYIWVAMACVLVSSFIAGLVSIRFLDASPNEAFTVFVVVLLVLSILAAVMVYGLSAKYQQTEYLVECPAFGDQFHVIKRAEGVFDYNTGKRIFLPAECVWREQ